MAQDALPSAAALPGGKRAARRLLARPDVGLVSPLIWKPPPVHVQGVALHAQTMWMRVPNMQHYYGLNDRLAYGSRDAMLYVSNEARRRPPAHQATRALDPRARFAAARPSAPLQHPYSTRTAHLSSSHGHTPPLASASSTR